MGEINKTDYLKTNAHTCKTPTERIAALSQLAGRNILLALANELAQVERRVMHVEKSYQELSSRYNKLLTQNQEVK